MTRLADRFGPTLVVAPHADDEILGCGGVIARLADEGAPPTIAIVSEGVAPDYPAEQVAALKQEAAAAAAILGAAPPRWLGFPAARLDELPGRTLNAALATLVAELAPRTLLLPFPGDIHRDHQLVFQAAMVAARPTGPGSPAQILCYETVSETNWNAPGTAPGFLPTVTIDIAATLERKLAAFTAYASQLRRFPHERSIEALEALARLRGATHHLAAAEAFVLMRERW
jgi:LmbE family N-acetylglucosaminyl deacetylase